MSGYLTGKLSLQTEISNFWQMRQIYHMGIQIDRA